jgi:hypothetical protein
MLINIPDASVINTISEPMISRLAGIECVMDSID